MTILYNSIQVCLCLVFIISAVMKLRDMSAFVDLVMEYRVLPKSPSMLYAWVAPFAELAGGVLILFPVFVHLGSILLFGLLLSFFFAVSLVIFKQRDIDCGCYGKWMESRADGFTLVKIIALTGLVVALLIFFPEVGSQFGFISIPIGVVLTAIFFVMQMLWNYFRENNNLLS